MTTTTTTASTNHPPTLQTLPLDILYLILSFLRAPTIHTLSQSSRTLHTFITTYWTHHLLLHPRPTLTLTLPLTPASRALYTSYSDANWAAHRGLATDVLHVGRAPPQGAMAVSRGRIFVASVLRLWEVDASGSGSDSSSGRERGRERFPVVATGHVPEPTTSPIVGRRRQHVPDITSLLAPSQGTLLMGTADGRISRLSLSSSPSSPSSLRVTETARYTHPSKSRITALIQPTSPHSSSSPNDLMLSLAHHAHSQTGINTRGLLALHRTHSPWLPPHTVRISGIPTSGLFTSSYIAIGTRANHPSPSPSSALTIHSPDLTKILTHLHPSKTPSKNSAYALAAHPSSHPSLLLSGWYSSHIHTHDLRAPQTHPTQSLHDRFTDLPVYSLAAGGGSQTHVVAGLAAHGVLQVYDIRNPARSWGMYSPGRTSASVYQVHVEGSRIWGLSDRVFVVDMGPDASGQDVRPLSWLHAEPTRALDRLPQGWSVT